MKEPRAREKAAARGGDLPKERMMNVSNLNATVSQEQAQAALREYKQARPLYDGRDWEIERIYRRISKGETVISVVDAIVGAGLDEEGRPRLAICQAHALLCRCTIEFDRAVFGISPARGWGPGMGRVTIPWRGLQRRHGRRDARLPRIPPQHRVPASRLHNYHLLWEADWEDREPVDPYLLKRIGRDAWVVVAAWELTEVELLVLRAHN